jgi:hypothetical protein
MVASLIVQLVLTKVAATDKPAEDEVEEVEEVERKPALPPMEALVWLELKKGELVCEPAAMNVFQDEPGFVNPVMVSGKLRTGKSYLMNALSDSNAFGVSAQARSFTQGVHICDRLVPCSTFGGPEDGPKLAFVDAEGQADKGKSYDIKLATPLLLVSKVIIMNEVCPIGPSKEDILRTIEIFMRAAEQVSERKKRKGLFGNLHLIMRDCAQPDQECWDIIFESEDSNQSETDEQAKAIEERNKIREGIFNAFESVPKVWCLPKLMSEHAPKSYRDCSPQYIAKIEEMRAYMAVQLAQPKLIDDKPLTGTMIAALMPQLQEALKSDSPILNPPSMMQAVCDLEAERVAQAMAEEAERYFRIDMAKKLPLPSPYYEGEVDCAKAMLAQKMMLKLDHLPNESQEKVFPPFEQRLNLMDERLAAVNREKLAERATQEAVERANQLQQEMENERRRADDARNEIDNLLAAREHERNRADMLLRQIEESNEERQAERDRIKELEELLNKEVGEREADLQKQVEEEKKKVEEAAETAKQEEVKQQEALADRERAMEEQRLEMQELEIQMEEERKARADAERELGLREEDIAKEDEAAQLIERTAEAKKEIPLILAVKEADIYAVRGLVRRHPDSLHMKDKNQRTAMHFADDKDTTVALLKGKADPNAQDMGLWTPLHNAASKGSYGVAEALMQASGNVLLTTRHGNTALDLAYDKPDVTVMLLSQLPELYGTLEPETTAAAEAAAEQAKRGARGSSTPAAAGHADPDEDVPENKENAPAAEDDSAAAEADAVISTDAEPVAAVAAVDGKGDAETDKEEDESEWAVPPASSSEESEDSDEEEENEAAA